jgi:hypothetical protein
VSHYYSRDETDFDADMWRRGKYIVKKRILWIASFAARIYLAMRDELFDRVSRGDDIDAAARSRGEAARRRAPMHAC